jgi:uncharacterized coiled-coil DUF342 family protein
MKTEDALHEQIAQLQLELFDARFALTRCKNYAKASKDSALPVSKPAFEEIEKIVKKAEKIAEKAQKYLEQIQILS